MECFNHQGAAAVGTCRDCGKGLCVSCVKRFVPAACEPCVLSHNASVARRLYVDLVVTAIIFIGVAILAAYNAPANKSGGIFIGLLAAGAYWGWKFLNRIPMPPFFMSGFAFAVYLLIKFILSMMAGFIVAPWEIFKRIREIRAINSLKKEIDSKKATQNPGMEKP